MLKDNTLKSYRSKIKTMMSIDDAVDLVVYAFEHAEAGAKLGLMRRILGNSVLLRLNYGVFVLHFILTASFLVVPGLLEQSFGVDREEHWMVYLPVLLLSLAGMVPLMIMA